MVCNSPCRNVALTRSLCEDSRATGDTDPWGRSGGRDAVAAASRWPWMANRPSGRPRVCSPAACKRPNKTRHIERSYRIGIFKASIVRSEAGLLASRSPKGTAVRSVETASCPSNRGRYGPPALRSSRPFRGTRRRACFAVPERRADAIGVQGQWCGRATDTDGRSGGMPKTAPAFSAFAPSLAFRCRSGRESVAMDGGPTERATTGL